MDAFAGLWTLTQWVWLREKRAVYGITLGRLGYQIMTPGTAFALCFWLPFWIVVPVILVELGGLPERFVRSTPIEMPPEWHIGAGTAHESAELMK